MRTVLVTGATGFIGRHALDPLVARGFRVHAVTSRPLRTRKSDVTWHRADLLNLDAVSALVASVRPSDLLHFAWSLAPGGSVGPIETLRWVQATLDLVRQFEQHGGTRAVIAGSCAEYDWNHGYCLEDRTPLAPRSVLRRRQERRAIAV